MFLSEMVRHVGDSILEIDEAPNHGRQDSSWGTLYDYGSINPATAGIYACSFDGQRTGSNPAYIRVKVGSRYVWGISPLTSSEVRYEFLCYLPTGSQNVIVESISISGPPYGTANVDDFRFGRVDFSDVDGEALQTYSSGLTLNVPQRNLPIGSLNEVGVIVSCWAYTPGADTNFESVGDSLTNGVSLTVEGVQVDWSERNQDTVSAENAWAVYYGKADAAQDISVSIAKDNGNTVVHICVIACPWIIPDDEDFEPITLSFPQGSTLYLMSEPLILNPTVNMKIGKERVISFGDATDYYSTASGTGILQHDYTFVEVKNGAVLLFIYGRGACVASIGVDIR